MIWILALAIIILGLYLIVSGLREETRMYSPEFEARKTRELHECDDYEYENKVEKRGRSVKGGGVILIGPIPIVFGDSKFAVVSLILAIVLMLLSIFLIFSLHA